MLAGGLGTVRPQFAHKTKIYARRAAHRARRPWDADRARGGCGVEPGSGHGGRGAGLCVRAEGESGDAAAVPAGHRRVRGARFREPDPEHSRRRRGWVVQRAAGARARLGPRSDVRDPRCAPRRRIALPDGDMVQRVAGALRPRGGPRARGRIPRYRRARALPVCNRRYVATETDELVVTDRLFSTDVIRMKMSTLFGKPPRMARSDSARVPERIPFDATLATYLPAEPSHCPCDSSRPARVLRLPSVGSKAFLITIGDRSITGLVTRDQMVGPWQVPVADVAVTRASYGFGVSAWRGDGHRRAHAPRASLCSSCSAHGCRRGTHESRRGARACARTRQAQRKLDECGERIWRGCALYEAVRAVGMELCPALGVGIPVGKDSMSMAMRWRDSQSGEERSVTAPLSLIVTAFAGVEDVGATWTPQLRTDVNGPTVLVFFDLACRKQRLGGSAFAQVFRQIGAEVPDVEDPQLLKAFFNACQAVRKSDPELVLAYHDRSDGGLFTTVAEMAFAGRVGVEVNLDALHGVDGPVEALFNEELGAVVQVQQSRVARLVEVFVAHGFESTSIHAIGKVLPDPKDQSFTVVHQGNVVFRALAPSSSNSGPKHRSRCSHYVTIPDCAAEEFALIADETHTGLKYELTFTPTASRSLFRRPKVAILREQGVNGHVEMAWAFTAAGFDAVDVHMSDIIGGTVDLAEFRGLAACGGFSYGDVLGAGAGGRTRHCCTRGAGGVRCVLCARRRIRAGRVQRVPVPEPHARGNPRHGVVAVFQGEPQRAVRGARGARGGGGQRRDTGFGVPPRYGWLAAAGGGCPW
jgi:hypothetical protein